MFDKTGRGIITWREFSALLKALGIPDIPLSLLHRVAPDHPPETSPGLDHRALLRLLHSPLFATSLDYTYNRHNSTYNVRVIKRALGLLVEGFLTLEDLRASRMGFTLYEGETCNGIMLEAQNVAAVMRVSGKAIAPRKLQAWIEGLDEDVPGRLQLYEFLELVKLSNDRGEQVKAVQSVTTSIERSRIGLFELTDADFLLTPGQKLSKQMDEDYEGMLNALNMQQMMPRETAVSKNNNPDYHSMMQFSKMSKRAEEGLDMYGHIRDSVKMSTANVYTAKVANFAAPRPRTVAGDRKSQLPSLHLASPIRDRKRSTSAPAMRSPDGQKTTNRTSDGDNVSFADGKMERESSHRHLSSAPAFLRGSYTMKEKTDGIDTSEFAIPKRKMENYPAIRDYISTNGEAQMSRIIASSIGATYKNSTSPPSSPPGPRDGKKKGGKAKRPMDGKTPKGLQNIHKEKMEKEKLGRGSASSILEELGSVKLPPGGDLTKPSLKNTVLFDTAEGPERVPSSAQPPGSESPTKVAFRLRSTR